MIFNIPDEKETLVEERKRKLMWFGITTTMGLITDNERYNQIIDIWTKHSQLTSTLMEQLGRMIIKDSTQSI